MTPLKKLNAIIIISTYLLTKECHREIITWFSFFFYASHQIAAVTFNFSYLWGKGHKKKICTFSFLAQAKAEGDREGEREAAWLQNSKAADAGVITEKQNKSWT